MIRFVWVLVFILAVPLRVLSVIFTSSPLVSSVDLHLPHSFLVWICISSTRFECSFKSSPLVASVILGSEFKIDASYLGPTVAITQQLEVSDYSKLHSKRVERCKTTLETCGEDVKLHSKRVEKIGTH